MASENPNINHDFSPVLAKYTFNEVKVGDVFLPTGRIICADPFFMNFMKPFVHKVAPGKYPVVISIYKIEEDHYRVAYGRIRFSDLPAVRWQLAITEEVTEEQIASLQPGEFFGYGVDAGLACFTDAETNEMFNKVLDDFFQKDDTKNYYDDLLAAEFRGSSGGNAWSRPEGDWNDHYPVKGDERNIVMFASGWGDGSYPVYWGYDAAGNVVELVTDFGVVGYEAMEG